MTNEVTLNRFMDAQRTVYDTALAEIKNGRKRSHWMWYIFPQIQGLGFSQTSRFYAINNREEAVAYLNHSVLGERLINISNELLKLPTGNANSIFGSPDDLKLRSSMTLFAALPNTHPVFEAVLMKFFGGIGEGRTLELLNKI
ncbi:DUF1810 domain-containing protein [Mucilaginibacter gotjawali]|uniref:Uncharacterized protein (DUF1810 family) n=2 Tax=Mucilaginibacter gotjawali TaxID=1550579 RepID=A0A839SIN5_9SPHI|nr:DUF1810 domain-containing protein [Mucilaginibacter gotjawali]MBB3058191.1 uncharacterized protein (DUF1810 family) [Mucilaginibacter gotjawali]